MKQILFRLVAALLGFSVGFVTAGLGRLPFVPSNLDSGADLLAYAVSPDLQSDLRQQIARARWRGENQLSIITLSCGMEISDLSFALANHSVVVARPVERRTYEAEAGLRSWYRFQVVETLSTRVPQGYLWDPAPPADMLPLGENEFLIPATGGTMVINGVTVNHSDSSHPHYAIGQAYLLFLNFNAESRVAYVPWSDTAGRFLVHEDGTLHSNDHEPYALSEQLRRHFGNSIDRLRRHFRR